MKRQPNYTRYGNPGDSIPGSNYYRGYCRSCGDPIRVSVRDRRRAMLCECGECRKLGRTERGRLKAEAKS